MSYCFVSLKEGVDKGELLFSLQFLPTSSRLTLAVIKARNLKINGEAQGTETLGEFNSHFRFSLVHLNNKLKKVRNRNKHFSFVREYNRVPRGKNFSLQIIEKQQTQLT